MAEPLPLHPGRETAAGGPVLIEAIALNVQRGRKTVLENVDLTVRRGEIVTLIGPNGSGKTTLVRTLLGLIRADSGKVCTAGGMTVGYVPQQLAIDPTLPIDVARFLAMAGTREPGTAEAALREVGAPLVIDRQLRSLSGGELKRVLLARALLRDPDLLVLDEPTANVDVHGQTDFYDLVQRIREDRDCGILLVSHDLHLVMAATDRVLCLNGHICCSGRPEDVSRHPAYLALFGEAAAVALYTHEHDHRHDVPGAEGALHDHVH